MATNSPSDEWFQTRHQQWHTPRRLINAYVRKAVGRTIVQMSRIIAGLDNEVYTVLTTNRQPLIVRISHQADPRFEAEQWALNAARAVGVPTPHVLLIEQAAIADTTITFCIEEKLPGTPLDVLLQAGTTSGVNQALDRIGALLGQLHSIQVEGFGYLQPEGKGTLKSFAERMLTVNEQAAQLYAAANHWLVPAQKITMGLALLNQHRALYHWDTPVLLHGDFVAKHILVNGEHISGLIDMQDCAGGHPVFDLVTWELYWGKRIPLRRIIASYGNQSLFNAHYEALFHLVLLRASLVMLMIHAQQDNPHHIQDFIAGLELTLRYFSPSG